MFTLISVHFISSNENFQKSPSLCFETVGTNMWNVKGAIVSQTVPRNVSRRQQVGELMIFGVKNCVAQRLAMINYHRCYIQKFTSVTVAQARRKNR